MKNLKNIISRIIPCILIVLCILGVASCKSCKKADGYKYPSVTPAISNPESTFVQIGDYKVTNEQMYARLLQSYGVSALCSLVDEVIFKDYAIVEADYLEYLDKFIYNTDDPSKLTEEEKAEALENFKANMNSLGIETEEDWQDYYRLEYAKIQYAIEKYKAYIAEYDANEDNTEDFFTEDEYKTYYEANYHGTVDVIFVTFDSIVEAQAMMKLCNIDTNSLFGNWKKLDGTEMTYTEIFNAFVNMYNEMNEKAPITDAVTYEYDDLYSLSSTICSKAFGMTSYDAEDATTLTASYTHGPLLYGSRYYLLLKTSETEPAVSLEDAKAEIFDEMLDNDISTYYIAAKASEARYDADLKIYDEGLEILYKTSYDTIYTNLEQTDYKAFKSTTEESATNIASFTYKDQTYNITAQQMFDYLTNTYGTLLTSLLLEQYVVLNNRAYNNVYDYIKNEVLDQETFDEYIKAEVTEYKEAFNNGEYASSGYPASYGWDNFIKDFLGVFNENELIVNLDSTLYKESLAKLGKTIYTSEVVYDETDPTVVVKPADNAVQEEMKRLYDEFFGGSVIGLSAYYDKDLNSLPDTLDAASAEALLAKEFVNKLYEFATALDYKTTALKLTNATKIYNNATINDATWGTYKKAGLRVTSLSSTSYTNTSSADEAILNTVKTLWTNIEKFATENSITSSIMGVSLDPGVRTVVNSNVVYASCEKFANEVDACVTSTGVYRLVMTNASKRVAITITSEVYDFPTLEEYENYLLPDTDTNKTTVSSTLTSQITTYYKVAIENLASETAVNNLLMNECIKLLPNVTFTSNQEKATRILTNILNNNIVTE